MDVTQSFAATFVDELAAQGIEYACVSPGSRSAPVELPNAARLGRRLAARAVAEAIGGGGPVHVNLPFREPLVPQPGQIPVAIGAAGQSVSRGRTLPTATHVTALASALQRAQRPLVIAGEMRDGERLAPALHRLGLPVLAEPTSQLRRPETGASIESDEALLRAGWSLQHGPDLVIRLGGMPTSRALNKWLAAASAPTFLIDPDHAWRDQDPL